MLRVPYDVDETIEFALGPRRYLNGTLSRDCPDRVSWSIDVACREARFNNQSQKTPEQLAEQKEHTEFLTSCNCFVEISRLSFPVTNWRELSGQSIEITYDQKDLVPIMPDIESVFYYDSQHYATINNRISIGARKGIIFKLSWKFDAMASEDDMFGGMELETTVALKEFWYIDDPLTEASIDRAIDAVSSFVDPNDLARDRIKLGKFCVYLPLRTDLE